MSIEKLLPRAQPKTPATINQLTKNKKTGVVERPDGVVVLDPVFITARDGVQLAARIWMPKKTFDNPKTNPAPALIEQLPYRRRDATCYNDEPNHHFFAKNGYVSLRVDFRGFGDSTGYMEDEVTSFEQSDIIDVVAWLGQQNFCNGHVGMFGLSWGAINAALTACSISHDSTGALAKYFKAAVAVDYYLDRFYDDIHYKNGVPMFGSVYWNPVMICYGLNPPDPMCFGTDYLILWQDRMKEVFSQLPIWKSNDRREGFWQQGTLVDAIHKGKINVPLLAFGGWQDCYRDVAFDSLKIWKAAVKTITGHWGHYFPNAGYPEPGYDFHGTALAFFDEHLKSGKKITATLPDITCFIAQAVKPIAPKAEVTKGEWISVSKEQYQSAEDNPVVLHLKRHMTKSDTDLSYQAKEPDAPISLKTPEDLGASYGHHFPMDETVFFKDQQIDDAKSVCFDSPVLSQNLEFLGKPILSLALKLKAKKDINPQKLSGHIFVRLNDVHPDGTSFQVSYGCFNLNFLQDNAPSRQQLFNHLFPESYPVMAHPNATPDKNGMIRIEFDLHALGYCFLKGHKLRLALSTSFFPLIMPQELSHELEIVPEESKLRLPPLTKKTIITVPKPQDVNYANYLNMKYLNDTIYEDKDWTDDDGRHWHSQLIRYGWVEHPEHKLLFQEEQLIEWGIHPDQPNSAKFFMTYTCHKKRNGGKTYNGETMPEFNSMTHSRTEYSTDKNYLFLKTEANVELNGKNIFKKMWENKVQRR